jgi:MFS family permease
VTAVLGGWTADRLERRETFLASLVVFTLATIIGGVVTTRAAALHPGQDPSLCPGIADRGASGWRPSLDRLDDASRPFTLADEMEQS